MLRFKLITRLGLELYRANTRLYGQYLMKVFYGEKLNMAIFVFFEKALIYETPLFIDLGHVI